MNSIEKIRKVLVYHRREDLANLLKDAIYDFNESSTYGSRYNSLLTTVNIYSPIQTVEKLRLLTQEDKQAIIDAFLVIYPIRDNDIEINHIEFFVDPDSPILNDDISFESEALIESNFWEKDYFRLFISHSSKIKDLANSLKNFLERYGISAFVAHEDIEPTKDWQNVIQDALKSCDALVALLTADFQNSKWTDQEIGICLGLNKIVIPVRLGIDPYGFIGKYQGLMGVGKNIDSIAHDIFMLLSNKDETEKAIAKAVVLKFSKSVTYKDAKANMSRLENINILDKLLVKILEQALEDNDQIYNNIGLPARLNNYLQRFDSLK